jgi:hypothetical protein
MATGISASKANVYSVLSPNIGISVSKTSVYSVLVPFPPGINVSKAVVYSVIYHKSAGFLQFMARFMG